MNDLSDDVRVERGSPDTMLAYEAAVSASLDATANGPTVLVVDDDAWMRSVLADLLPVEGYKVEEAGNGASAIRLAKKDRPDVVILDLVLPGMSGLDVLRELKKDSWTNSIPVIVFSAYASQLPTDCAPRAEAVIEKPIDVCDLLDQIQRVINQADRHPESAVVKSPAGGLSG
jgi:CheY-like chemotaxis protein